MKSSAARRGTGLALMAEPPFPMPACSTSFLPTAECHRFLLSCMLLPDQLQLTLQPALQQSQLLRTPAVEHLPQLGQGRLLLLLQVGLRQLQLCRVHVAQAQAQGLQLQAGRRLGTEALPMRARLGARSKVTLRST